MIKFRILSDQGGEIQQIKLFQSETRLPIGPEVFVGITYARKVK